MIYSVLKRTLLGEQLLALRTQGGNAQGTSTQRIKLMEPERFKDKLGSNILQWLDCIERYLTAGQVAEEEKNPSYLDLPRATRGPILANSCQRA